MANLSRPCTLLISSDGKLSSMDVQAIREHLESKEIEKKREGVKAAILHMANGKDMSEVLMHVIRFCVTVDDHELTKLLQLYWECVVKVDATGKLKDEMLLVINAILQNLKHPNEYIRGTTLRFLCKITEIEILEPLVEVIRENLDHRHPYVRRNAVMTVYSIYKSFGDRLMPEAPDIISEFIQNETDASARRNAFSFLIDCAPDRAVEYLEDNAENLDKLGDCFQLVCLDLIRKVCFKDPTQKGRFVKPLFGMLNSESSSVSYEAATTLYQLSNNPSAVKSSATTLLSLLNSQTDNNIKLVILEKLKAIVSQNPLNLQDMVMDVLHCLKNPYIDIRKEVLDIAMCLISNRNINEVINYLKKEMIRMSDQKDNDKDNTAYRQLLIKSIHICTVKFPEIAPAVVHLLLDYLNTDAASQIMCLTREIMCKYPDMQTSVIEKLQSVFLSIDQIDILQNELYLLGEYSEGSLVESSWNTIINALGPLPLLSDISQNNQVNLTEAEPVDSEDTLNNKPKVLADGTYATQAYMEEEKIDISEQLHLRHLLLEENYYLYTYLCSTLIKLTIKSYILAKENPELFKIAKARAIESIEIMIGLLDLGKRKENKIEIDQITKKRIEYSINILLNKKYRELITDVLLTKGKEAFEKLINNQKSVEETKVKKEKVYSIEDTIIFRQLRDKSSLGLMLDLDDQNSLQQATEFGKTMEYGEKLQYIYQLTGYGDNVYCEAFVYMQEFDIIMEITCTNKSSQTLNDFNIELSATKSLKIVEKPSTMTVDGNETVYTRCIIKVNSTETGVIFGSITYSYSNNAQREVINMNQIQISLMDYIKPAYCNDEDFRTMWSQFEWENKVNVNTDIQDLYTFVNNICKITHMKCLTDLSMYIPKETKEGQNNNNENSTSQEETLDSNECLFLAANLYAKSMFGEDALLNISVEKQEDGKIQGFYRIRSKTQGIALSLGDRINTLQKNIYN
ncbi:hypothetical protein WA158_001398 [Blastocystis sp. Blastoise]